MNDREFHIGQIHYHMDRLGWPDTERFDIAGMAEHLRALGADDKLIDYVWENGRHGGYDGWMLRHDTHARRVYEFIEELDPEAFPNTIKEDN